MSPTPPQFGEIETLQSQFLLDPELLKRFTSTAAS